MPNQSKTNEEDEDEGGALVALLGVVAVGFFLLYLDNPHWLQRIVHSNRVADIYCSQYVHDGLSGDPKVADRANAEYDYVGKSTVPRDFVWTYCYAHPDDTLEDAIRTYVDKKLK